MTAPCMLQYREEDEMDQSKGEAQEEKRRGMVFGEMVRVKGTGVGLNPEKLNEHRGK